MSKLDEVISRVEALFRVIDNDAATVGERENAQRLAQQLMTKYQIEEAQLGNRILDEVIGSFNLPISNPYVIDKAILVHQIAKNNYCRVIRGRSYVVIYGYESDAKLVMSMYKMLNVHMIGEMWSELAKFRAMNPYSSVSTVSWKKSFFAGYASKIGQRLAEAKKEQIDSVASATGDNQFALVLVSKQKEVDKFFDAVPKGQASSRNLNSRSGYNSGQSAGGRADIGQARLSHTKALGR